MMRLSESLMAPLSIFPTARPWSLFSPPWLNIRLKWPRGAQVIYPKDLAVIPLWADVYPGCRVLEAGLGSGSLTMALLRAVGNDGCVVSYEVREDFSTTAMKNIERYMGKVPNHFVQIRDVLRRDRDWAGIIPLVV